MSVTFTKLVSSLPESSVWCAPYATRIVWVTMLATADQNGIVRASIPGLAKRAGVTLEECETALQTFLSPDPYSTTKDNEGRRIEVIDGGWRLLNYRKYRDARDGEAKREADRERQRKHRDVSRNLSHDVTGCHALSQTIAQAEAEAEAEADSIPPTPLAENQPPENLDDLVEEIGHLYPGNTHLVGLMLPQDQQYALCEAIVAHGAEVVRVGTLNYRDAVTQWPPGERRYMVNAVKFYREAHFLKDPSEWERRDAKQAKHSARQSEFDRASEQVARQFEREDGGSMV